MAKYIGPKSKIARKFGEPIFGTDKVLEKKNYPPGQHGLNRKRKKVSEYGMQLTEKQKAKSTYGLLEKQFHKTFVAAAKMSGITGENLLKLLECRLDNVVYRAGFARSRTEARQVVRHNHIQVNGKKVNIPSYQIKAGDVISLKEQSVSIQRFKDIYETTAGRVVPEWIVADTENGKISVQAIPTREQIDVPVNETLIVELYSK